MVEAFFFSPAVKGLAFLDDRCYWPAPHSIQPAFEVPFQISCDTKKFAVVGGSHLQPLADELGCDMCDELCQLCLLDLHHPLGSLTPSCLVALRSSFWKRCSCFLSSSLL